MECWQAVSTPHNATVESWNTGAQGTKCWPGPRSTRACLDGCASKNTHQSSHITSLPGRLIGWRRRQGRGSAKNRCDGPFWLNEPMRHQCTVRVPPLPWSRLGEKSTRKPLLPQGFCLYFTKVYSTVYNTRTGSQIHDRQTYIYKWQAVFHVKSSSEV